MFGQVRGRDRGVNPGQHSTKMPTFDSEHVSCSVSMWSSDIRWCTVDHVQWRIRPDHAVAVQFCELHSDMGLVYV